MSKKQSMEEIYLENRYWVYGSFLRKMGAVETGRGLIADALAALLSELREFESAKRKGCEGLSSQHDFACGGRLLA